MSHKLPNLLPVPFCRPLPKPPRPSNPLRPPKPLLPATFNSRLDQALHHKQPKVAKRLRRRCSHSRLALYHKQHKAATKRPQPLRSSDSLRLDHKLLPNPNPWLKTTHNNSQQTTKPGIPTNNFHNINSPLKHFESPKINKTNSPHPLKHFKYLTKTSNWFRTFNILQMYSLKHFTSLKISNLNNFKPLNSLLKRFKTWSRTENFFGMLSTEIKFKQPKLKQP
mmetsp:Transcript_14251/g.20258  ORF Transcript_14251/g.20258 Transcript_14251/m.20258 type:complete len:223 (+) Transcript_14251:904-1572(+)